MNACHVSVSSLNQTITNSICAKVADEVSLAPASLARHVVDKKKSSIVRWPTKIGGTSNETSDHFRLYRISGQFVQTVHCAPVLCNRASLPSKKLNQETFGTVLHHADHKTRVYIARPNGQTHVADAHHLQTQYRNPAGPSESGLETQQQNIEVGQVGCVCNRKSKSSASAVHRCCLAQGILATSSLAGPP